MNLLARLIEPKRGHSDTPRFSNAALFAMIVPLLVEQFLQMIVGLVDTLMVSYAGEATVSGVSLDTMVYTIFLYLFTAIATGGSVIVSQYIGSEDKALGDRSASQIFFLSGVFSLLCMGLMLLGGNGILRLLYGSVEPDVMDACQTYLWIVTLSFPANALYNAGAAIYRSMGKTRVTMVVSIAMNLLNVAGNAIGVFVLKAGAAGVAWPTTIAWYFAAVVMTALCFRKSNPVRIRLSEMVKPDGAIIRRILHVAVPNSIENGLFQASKVVLMALVATFGTVQIAANGIGQTIWSFAAMVNVALSPAFITVVGQCMGAGAVEEADYYLRKLTRLSLVLSFAWNALVVLCLPLLLRLYDISDETRQLVFVIVLIHNAFCATVQPFSGPMATGMRAAGDVKFTMTAALVCTVGIRVILSVLMGVKLGMGVVGIAWAMVIDWVVKAAMILWRYHTGRWKQFKII